VRDFVDINFDRTVDSDASASAQQQGEQDDKNVEHRVKLDWFWDMSGGRRSLAHREHKPLPLSISSSADDKYHNRGEFEQLPEWRRGSPFIRYGYRMNIQSLRDVLWSVFHVHNETLNIWTHLFGVAMMVYLGYAALTTWLKDAAFVDLACFAAFWIGQTSQMLFSAVFHTCSCWTPDVQTWGARLDYAGIALTIGGSFIQPLYYGFWCRPFWAVLYNGGVVSLCVFATYIIWNPVYHTKEWQWLRAAVFVVTAVFGAVVPLSHALFLVSPGLSFLHPMIMNLLEMGFFYLGGVAIYLYRAPERWSSHPFFAVVNSHCIWHLFILAAAVEHYNVEQENYAMFHPDGVAIPCDTFFQLTQQPTPLFANKRWFELWF
jgi:adiponectin receptor